MSTSTEDGGEGASAPAAVTASATPAATTATPAPIGITSEQLKVRLDETRDTTRTGVLKELGFQSVADAKKQIEAFKLYQQSQLTEQEKLQARLRDLEPHEKAAQEYRAKYERAIEREFKRLPEAMQLAIDEQSKREDGTVDPATREMLMTAFAKLNAVNGQSTEPNAASAAAKPASAAATTPAPKPAVTKTKFEEFEELRKTRPVAAAAFHRVHQLEIERTRPSN